jgi:hypothetical protein
MTRVEPNPFSPYATAAADVRHLFAVPFWLMASPRPGELMPTACGELAVVPETLSEAKPDDSLPEGVCGTCAQARQDDTTVAPSGPVTDCRECGLRTNHGKLCALCRSDLHDAWWLAKATGSPASTADDAQGGPHA